MKDIDFLPSRYRERQSRREAATWRVALLVLFGGALCAATLGQYALRRSVASQLRGVRQQFLQAKLDGQQIEILRRQLADANQRAELYTYLRHPWPRTRLLSEITSPLPETIALAELQVSQTESARQAVAGFQNSSLVVEANAPPLEAPAVLDLRRLRAARDESQTIISVTGSTLDTAGLNQYVARLTRSPLVTSARLLSLQADPADRDAGGSRFEIEVVIRPGYGQPGGPTGPLSDARRLAITDIPGAGS